MNVVEKANYVLKRKCNTLEAREIYCHSRQPNQYQRSSYRKNDVGIIGVKHSSSEKCIDIAGVLFKEITNKDKQMERSHWDGRNVNGKDRHILGKFYFYQDKVKLMKNVKHAVNLSVE